MTLPPPLPSKEQIALLPPFEGLGLARIHLVASPLEAKSALDALSRERVLGFDTESKPTFHRGDVPDGPHVVQFSTRSDAWIFRLEDAACREAVKTLLESDAVVKAGFGLGSDRSQLLRKLGAAIRSLSDLDDVLRQRGYRKSVGVKTAIALLFGRRFNKSKKTTTSNWSQADLTEAQLRYAANDAYAALQVHYALAAGATIDAAMPMRVDPPARRAAPSVRLAPAVPLLRIFDIERAHAFYLDYLGFHLDWEHRFDPTAPRYLQVGRGGCLLHLTEHHGDCTPGATVRIPVAGLAGYLGELSSRDYPYLRPSIDRMPWNEDVMEIIDPFGNRLRFHESHPDGEASSATG